MRYLKRCGCCALRYGVVAIGAVDLILASLSLGLSASKLSANFVDGKNETASSGQKTNNDGDSINAGALIDVVAQAITIIVAVLLIVVAVLHKTKFRRLLLIWLVWSILGLVLVFVAMIVGVLVYKSNFIDIFISLIVCGYIIVCFWFVLSYYKLMAIDQSDVNYNGSSNEKQFSAIG